APAAPPDADSGTIPPSNVGQPTVGSGPPVRERQPTLSPAPPASRPAPPPDLAPSLPPTASFPQVGPGKQFVVSSPVGTWSREVVSPSGNNEDTVRVTMKLDEDHLTIRVAMVVERQEVETVIEADYSIT